MTAGFELTVALRFLREGRMQTLLIIGGAAIGVAVIFFITAVLTGVQGDLIKRVTGAQPHVVIKPPEEVAWPLAAGTEQVPRIASVQARPQRLTTIDGWPALARAAEQTAGVTAVAPVASGSALGIKGDASRSLVLVGTELDRYLRVVRLDEKLEAGVLELGPGDALVGIELAKDLGAGVGDRFRVQSAQGGSEVLRIRALLDLGSRELNRRYVYTDLRVAQSLLGIPGRITNLDVAVADIMQADRVASRLRAQSGQLIETWIQTNNQVFAAINNQNIMTLLIRVFITIVVALGIASVLVVSVVQKRKEIGILRAVGATRRQMLGVFLLQGLMVGVAGALAGSALGLMLVSLFSRILRNAEGKALFSLTYDFKLIGFVVAGAAVLGLIAAVLPARNAARLDPAQAIRS
ncbi:MAG: ABC transporter permease [Betaproteobacteria bacterium]|jgi:lipoprotein-releasing system permease protein|nr:FtsX-like permease family protein [Betaproteobacteria bacterium]